MMFPAASRSIITVSTEAVPASFIRTGQELQRIATLLNGAAPFLTFEIAAG